MHQSSTKNRPETPDNQFLLRETVSKNGATPRVIRKGADLHEKQPLFDKPLAEPVKLTPAWEETNLPNDELNFKGVTMEQADLEINPPKDWCKLVYLTLLLHGIGTLLPWNMFINAHSYFVDFKLKTPNNNTDDTDVIIRNNFMNYLTFASQIPNVIFNWLNVFVHIGGNLTSRIVWSIMVEAVLFIFTVALAMSDSTEWPRTFFWFTIVTVVILNMANGIYQNTVFGMAAKLPFKYSGAVILGTNISGTFTSLLNLAARYTAHSARTAAIYYFITALFVLLVCFDTYFALPLNRYFRYHELLSKKAEQKQRGSRAKPHTPYWLIIKQCWPQLFNVFFIFFVTLTLFPSVLVAIKRYDQSFFISKGYFTDITCFLTFNVSAMLGSLLASCVSWPPPKFLVIPVTLRALFIPFFVFCNYIPDKRLLPVFIRNDYIYWVGVKIMGLTSGYFSALAMEYCPRSVEPQYAPIAGMLGGAFLITGIFSGVVFAMVFPWLFQS